jgi:HSP20 family protein
MSQTLPERRSRLEPDRWEPFSDFEQAAERMRRMLDQTFGALGWRSTTERAGWLPSVDIEETDDAYLVQAELPGIRREDVDIELVGNELSITGEAKDRKREGTVRKQARRYGRFDYRVSLPDQVDADKVTATLKDGVLEVRVPRAERASRKKIEVKAGS